MNGGWFGEWLNGTACVGDSDIEWTRIQFVVVEKMGLWRNRRMQLHWEIDLQTDIISIVQITSIIEAYLHTKQYNQRTAALEAYWWAATYQLALEHNLDNLLPAFAALQQNMSNLEHNSLNRIRNSDNHTLQPIDLLLLHLNQ